MSDSWMLHREASDHPEEVSTRSQGTREDKDSAVETEDTCLLQMPHNKSMQETSQVPSENTHSTHKRQ